LALADLNLPEGQGLDLVDERPLRHIPGIIVSSRIGERIKALEMGAND
jgi:DNA-binding response OmpR family regulator